MRKTLIIFAAVIALASCKKEVTNVVDQDKIFTHYVLAYNENTNTTTATATFRFASLLGTRLMLSEPSVILVNGTEMDWSDEDGFYTKEFSGLYCFSNMMLTMPESICDNRTESMVIVVAPTVSIKNTRVSEAPTPSIVSRTDSEESKAVPAHMK